MKPLLAHERPILLVLRQGTHPAEAFRALIDHPDAVAWHLPPPWVLEEAGVDLLDALPDLGAVTLESLPRVIDALWALCGREALHTLCVRAWAEADEQVRAFHLQRGALRTMASIFRLAPRTAQEEPPAGFVEDQVVLHPFAMEYRLRREAGPRDLRAPPEEASLVFYPFDPANASARREALLEDGPETILEAFAYAEGRDRHRRVLEDVAERHGWRVIDP